MTMQGAQQRRSSVRSDWLIQIVAECLKLPVDSIERDVPLVRYGMDSVCVVRLTAAIAVELQCEVPETLLLEYPDLCSLESYICQSLATSIGRNRKSPQEQMLSDSVLPSDLQPARGYEAGCPPLSILLTGATGFLGAFLLKSLLRETDCNVICLVRDGADNPLDRVRNTLCRYEIWDASFELRIRAVVGDLQQPGLGLSAEDLEMLVRDVGEIYHCGAAVNWVLPYEALRDVNVRGTLELLRIACRDTPKSFHFVSSMSACYSTSGPEQITELDDMLPYVGGIHLGYAQSKCVAESLVRQAEERGLTTTIHRPTLIAGDSITGVSNPDDLLWSMIRGCIQMGSAPDLDWVLDCCPVDYAADAIAGLSRQTMRSSRETRNRSAVFHLANTSTRHWREFVLWMNLFGYSIRLVAYREWLSRMRTSAVTPDHPLYRLRSFFLTRPSAANGLTLPQLYEHQHQSRVSQEATQDALATLSLRSPALDAKLLDRYFTSAIEQKTIGNVDRTVKRRSALHLNGKFFQCILRDHYHDSSLTVREVVSMRDAWQDSITTDLTSWRYSSATGLSQHRVTLDRSNRDVPKSLDLFVKVKPHDEEVISVAESVAAMCGVELGRAFTRHRQCVGIVGCDRREVKIYRQQERLFRQYVPHVYGAIENESEHQWILVLESLSKMTLMESVDDTSGWKSCYIDAAIEGIADLHSMWFGRNRELMDSQWLGPTMSSRKMVEMADLWTALADYASPVFSNWTGSDMAPLIRDLIDDVGTCWQSIEQMPRTLIHNDFNPRNIAFRDNGGKPRLCVYDWELATLGIPQHDLAELLCFVLRDDCTLETVNHYVDAHREALERAIDRLLDPISWSLGFRLSLNDLILNRFPMYCMANTFRPQPFLPRVIKTWRRLFDMFNHEP